MKIEKDKPFKKNIKQTVIVVYIVLSLGFIFFTLYNNFKINIIQKSYTTGYTKGQQDAEVTTVQKIIKQAENPDCKPFQVYIDTRKVNLMNISCLQTETKTSKTETSETPEKEVK